MKRILSILCLLALALLQSCGGKIDVSEPVEESIVLMVSVPSNLSVTAGQDMTVSFYSGKGPLPSDKVVLKASGDEYVAPINKVESDSFTFTLPEGLTTGSYSFCIRRGTTTKQVGTTKLTVSVPVIKEKIDPAPGATVYGMVACDGEGIPGVVVTDGYAMAVTNEKGIYQLASEKKNAMVYISTPSGYTAHCIGVQAQFYQPLNSPAGAAERHDFVLEPDGDQTNHTMMFFGDIHLASRTDDRPQFANFTAEINTYLKAHPGEKIYAMTLGDMTWDLYWYDKNYQFPNYLADVNVIQGMTIYHCIGNHDHNMKTSVNGSSAGWEAVDWDTAARYRSDMGPNYYSFNIGQIHYISIDDIYCKNTTGGASGDRKYDDAVVSAELEWLKKDLSYVGKDTPVVVTMHAPLYKQTGSASLGNASALVACFDGYSCVRFVTGHSHKLWTVDKGNIIEHNSGAVCAAWWWSGYYYRTLNIAQDGAPGGYRIMDVKGKTMTSYFKGTGRDAKYQFRSYDRNKIAIAPSAVGVTTYASEFSAYLTKYGGYNTTSTANQILINVWDWNSNWKVEATENGKPLTVTRQSTAYDPLYLLTYCAPRFKSTTDPSFGVFATYHIFKCTASSATSTVEIKVTDDEGRVYTETMTRPKTFSIATYQ